MKEIKTKAWHKGLKTMCDVFSFCEEFVKVKGNPTLKWERWQFEPLMLFTGLKDKEDREVYENYIYSEKDQGRKMLFIVTWINEYAAFAMLTPLEFKEYKKIGVEVIETSFEGFYVQLHRESFQKMKYEGNVYENPELLF